MISERMKELIKEPETVTTLETKSLAYLLDTTTDTLMLRNQQLRVMKDRLRFALERSLASQDRATKYARQLLFWMLMTLVFASGLIAVWFTGGTG